MDAIEFELVSLEDVTNLLKAESPPIFHKGQDPFKALRRRQGPIKLEGYASAWMATLPESARPLQCAKDYPRIVNNIAALWSHANKGTDYLSSLLLDTRPNRQGFPPHIKQELNALCTHRLAWLSRTQQDVWGVERQDHAFRAQSSKPWSR